MELIKEVHWKTAGGIGSKFMTCSLRADKDITSNDVRDEDNHPI